STVSTTSSSTATDTRRGAYRNPRPRSRVRVDVDRPRVYRPASTAACASTLAPRIRAVRATTASRLLACVLAAAALCSPTAAAAAPPRPAPLRGAAAAPTSVRGALGRLLKSGATPEAAYRQYTGAYSAARHSLTRLSGTRRSELGAVLANVQAIAAA